MRPAISVFILSSFVGACAAPDISDWPPTSPPVAEQTVQRYVDIYAAEEPEVPTYSLDDIMALNIISRRQLRNQTTGDDIEKLRDELDDIMANTGHEETGQKPRSKTEINAIKKRIARKYESHHDQRHILKSRYGL